MISKYIRRLYTQRNGLKFHSERRAMWLHSQSLPRNRSEISRLWSKWEIANATKLIPSISNETEIRFATCMSIRTTNRLTNLTEHECDGSDILSLGQKKKTEFRSIHKQTINHHIYTLLNLKFLQIEGMNILLFTGWNSLLSRFQTSPHPESTM